VQNFSEIIGLSFPKTRKIMQKFKRMKLMNFDQKLFELTSSNSNLE